MGRDKKNFTKTEKELLTFIYNGIFDYDRLASIMFVTKNTIETHMARIRRKTGCKNMAELVYKLVKFDRQKGDYMNGQLIAELGKVFERFGYNLTTIETKTTDKERVNITIEEKLNGN